MRPFILVVSLALGVSSFSVSKAEENAQRVKLVSLLSGLPGSDVKPTKAWLVKTLDKVTAVHNPTKKLIEHYLSLSDRANALAAILSENTEGFRDRLKEFGLRFVDFMPNELYLHDQVTHEKVPSFELKSFSNVTVAADEVIRFGNFLKILEFPWEDFVQHGNPTSAESSERSVFFREFIEKPYHRILTTSPNNRNRKRGSWVLRNFLCDDLTPTSLGRNEDESSSATDKPIAAVHSNLTNGATLTSKINLHATQKSCATCHWKLDYVSGFFRYLGTWGNDFRGQGRKLIYFAAPPFLDNDYDDFMAFWKREDGSWNLGVRRGTLVETPQDWHASTVSNDPVQTDLFAYLKTAPEFRQCLTNKMAKFYINDNLSYDSKWVNQLADELTKRPESQSGESFLKILGQLTFSNAYQVRDPDAGLCYDYAAGAPKSEIPCNVSQLLETKCMSCHSDDSTNLRLGKLVDLPGGGRWVDHVDYAGKPLTSDDSLRLVLQRLTSLSEWERMPLGQAPLTETERNTLVHWLNKLMKGAR